MIQVIDSVEDYLKLMRTIFDFDALKALLHKPDFTFTFDAMHGVSGPYARRIFVQVGHTCTIHCFHILGKRMSANTDQCRSICISLPTASALMVSALLDIWMWNDRLDSGCRLFKARLCANRIPGMHGCSQVCLSLPCS